MNITLRRTAATVVAAATVATGALAAGAGTANAAYNNYGAIALNQRTGASGWAVDYASYGAADGAALAKCGYGCSVVVHFANACGAVAETPTRWGWAWAGSRAGAENAARNAAGGGAIRVWACTTR